MDARALLLASFRAAVDSVLAEAVLPAYLPQAPKGRGLVVGAGKAAAAMAASVEAHWPDGAPLEGLVITRHGHGAPTRRIEVVEAGHPLPDAAGLDAAGLVLELLRQATPDDRVLALISGGGSSLLTLPVGDLELADVHKVSGDLLRSGAPIADINCVRKHLSRTLGGRLAAACRAPITALLISDVTGDDPSVIASGPFTPDPSSFADVVAVLARYGIAPPAAVRHYLAQGLAGDVGETPKPGDPCFAQVDCHVIANGRTALEGAARFFRQQGITPVILGDTYTGEARELAQAFAALAREVRQHGQPWHPPVALLSGGEASVTVRGNGHGGRNSEFLLALALALDGRKGVHALACDTDGIDGLENNAGAVIDPDTLSRARALGLDGRVILDDNDAYRYFAALGDLVNTGPTRTNANDYRAVLIT